MSFTKYQVDKLAGLPKGFVNNEVGYQVPKGSEILVHRSNFVVRGTHLTAAPSDFEIVVSTKPVTYTPMDVCLSPINGATADTFVGDPALGYGIRGSLYHNDQNYYGFKLPKNNRGAAFILVRRNDIILIPAIIAQQSPISRSLENVSINEFNKHMNDFVNSVTINWDKEFLREWSKKNARIDD